MPAATVKHVSVHFPVCQVLQSTDTWSRYLHCGSWGSPPAVCCQPFQPPLCIYWTNKQRMFLDLPFHTSSSAVPWIHTVAVGCCIKMLSHSGGTSFIMIVLSLSAICLFVYLSVFHLYQPSTYCRPTCFVLYKCCLKPEIMLNLQWKDAYWKLGVHTQNTLLSTCACLIY